MFEIGEKILTSQLVNWSTGQLVNWSNTDFLPPPTFLSLSPLLLPLSINLSQPPHPFPLTLSPDAQSADTGGAMGIQART